jgi:hypothetical protein
VLASLLPSGGVSFPAAGVMLIATGIGWGVALGAGGPLPGTGPVAIPDDGTSPVAEGPSGDGPVPEAGSTDGSEGGSGRGSPT